MLFSFFGLYIAMFLNGNEPHTVSKRTVIQWIEIDGTFDKVPKLYWEELNYAGNSPDWKSSSPQWNGNTIKWVINTKDPFEINQVEFAGTIFNNIFEPGDSINIIALNNKLMFSGRGADKLIVLQEISDKLKELTKPSKLLTKSQTVDDYLQWFSYTKSSRKSIEDFLEANKPRINRSLYERIKVKIHSDIEYQLLIKFDLLSDQRNKNGLRPESLCHIFDSTINRADSRWLLYPQIPNTRLHYLFEYIYLSVHRAYYFETPKGMEKDNPDRLANKCKMIFEKADSLLDGRVQQEVQCYTITEYGIEAASMNPKFEKMLENYYQNLDDPKLETYVRDFEAFELKRNLKSGKSAPYFNLTDRNDNFHSIKNQIGNTVLLYFRESGNPQCENLSLYLDKLIKRYNKYPNFRALIVSLDSTKTKWIETLKNDTGLLSGAVQLYTNKDGHFNPVLKGYQLTSLPAVYIISDENKIIKSFTKESLNNLKEEISLLLEAEIAKGFDGPYVFQKDDEITIYSIDKDSIHTSRINKQENPTLTSKTDEPDIHFKFKLASNQKKEPSEFDMPEKMFVLSDIEGNFQAFRRLLQANNIINEQFDWTFGKGHLVFAGDMFDRGRQVTECLWLIYSLEQKARLAGGYVHFILGNHEILNLGGNTRYVNTKYTNNANRLNIPYKELYNETSELGKWLRTKNVIEKIGDYLFAHGGVSADLISLNLSLNEINDLTKQYYSRDAEAVKSNDPRISILFNDSTSPFWYRGYYKSLRAGSSEKEKQSDQLAVIEKVLKKYTVKRIVTGHTIVSEIITSHFDGKVINTDTHHAKGHSAGLLVEGDELFSVGADGKKMQLEKF